MLELVYPPYLLYFSFWARSDSTHGAHSYSTEVRGRKKKHPRQEPQGLAQEQGRRVHQGGSKQAIGSSCHVAKAALAAISSRCEPSTESVVRQMLG